MNGGRASKRLHGAVPSKLDNQLVEVFQVNSLNDFYQLQTIKYLY